MINYENPAQEEGRSGGGERAWRRRSTRSDKNQKGEAASLKSTGIELEKLVVKPFCVRCFKADTKRARKVMEDKRPSREEDPQPEF